MRAPIPASTRTVTALRVEADLEVSIDGITLRASGDDGVLVVTTHRWLPVAFRLQRVAGPRMGIRSIAADLAAAGVTVRLDSAAGPLLVLGAGAHPTRFDRALGLRHLRTTSPSVLWRHSGAVRATSVILLVITAVVWTQRRRHPSQARAGTCPEIA